MKPAELKSPEEIKIMYEGGQLLAKIKHQLISKVKPGVKAEEIENLATTLINQTGGKPSFKMVPGYKWSTCININEGIVHGIPRNITFKNNDLVSVDVGLFYKGFHTDTSVSVYLGDDPKITHFFETGKKALRLAIKQAKSGRKIGDISRIIGSIISSEGYSPATNLTGHGVGRSLHENPRVPCLLLGSKDENYKITNGLVLAIEVMYSLGSPELVVEKDGWTISTKDGKISALFEDSVAITKSGPIVLTEGNF